MRALAQRPLAVFSALQEELQALIPLLEASRRVSIGARVFHSGRIHGHEVVLALTGIGKVAAAISTTIAIQHFNACALVFTGVAGGLGDAVAIGDLVLARELLQHDIDASPLFPRFEVPLTGRSRFSADAALPEALAVEMEGAAVAQVWAAFGTPFAVLRTISDRADDCTHGDFAAFIADVASVVTRTVVQEWLAALARD